MGLLISAVVTVLWVVIAAAAVCGVFWSPGLLWHEYRTRGRARAHRRAKLLARAEIQHHVHMAGDLRRIHGHYPSAAV